ncbi:MAG: ABC transporter substrate-binding protein [Oscillospiraceae bacterium]|nr:ABC transporter substrate-binding protein [Oscillospiraceae bacterium]
MKKTLALLLAAVLCLGALAACGDSGSSGATANTTSGGTDTGSAGGNPVFKLGGTGPLTGGAAIYGNAVYNAAQIAVEEINALDGVHFELKFEDDQHDAEKAVNAYNALKDWGMQVSISSVTSKPAEATSVEAYNDRVFSITPSASSTATTEGKDNVFQMCFIDPAQGTMAAQTIARLNLSNKVAVIWKNDDVYSAGIHETFLTEAAAQGIEVVSDTTFADGSDTDFSVQIADAQAKGAELVFLPMYYQPASLIFAQARAAGYAPVWFGVDGMDGILTLEGFDTSLAENVYLLTPFNAWGTDARNVSFVEKYQQRFGDVPNQFAADSYDCVYALKQALDAAGCTPDMSNADICSAMLAQFTSMTFDGLTGTGATWDGATGRVSKNPLVVVIRDGIYVAAD